MAMIHVSRSGSTLGVFEEEKLREGLRTGEFIETDLGWTEGMANWRPLSELDDFRTPAAAPPTAAPAPEPTTATSATALSAAGPTPIRAGLPWENREAIGSVSALIETVKQVLLTPDGAFRVMRREGGLLDPVLYALVLGLLTAVVSFCYSLGFHALGLGMGSRGALGSLVGAGGASFMMLICMPFIILICVFIGAGLIHLSLMLLGGANQSFETTVRVFCYSSGSANVLGLIPLCGGILSGICSIVLNCIGLARAHETDTWRAVVAVLLPMVVCCGGGALLFSIVIGSIAAGTNWH